MTNLAALFSSLRNRIKERTTFEKCLICLVILFVLAVIGLITALFTVPKTKQSFVCKTTACYAAGFAIKNSIDWSVDPCKDFYSYCCGKWEKSHTIPQDLNKYGTIERLQIDLMLKLKDLFENYKQNATSIQNAVKFYQSCMNRTSITDRGTTPLINFLKEIGGWPVIDAGWSEKNFDWLTASAKIQFKTGYGHILPIIVATDPKNTTQRLLQIDQPSLLISDDILQNRSKKSYQKDLLNFKELFSKIAKLLGGTKPNFDSDFNDIIELEEKILQMMSRKEKMKDISYWYNNMTVSQLRQKIPEINWLRYFQELTNSSLLALENRPVIQDQDTIIVRDLLYVTKISSYLTNPRNSRQISTYLGFRAIMTLMLHLPQNFSEVFEQYYRESGYPRQTEDRWKTCVNRINSAFDQVASFLYVKKYFPSDVKNEVLKLILDVSFQFETLIRNNDWMDRQTKLAAIKKLRLMKINVGYPDWMTDEITLDELLLKNKVPKMGDHIFENDLNLMEHRTMQVIKSLRVQPLKEEWPISPITINAAYNRNLNSITFPAAFLQPPLYNSLPHYVNYAAIGSIIGHEITHGFDSEGSQRDGKGNVFNWWSNLSKQTFHNKTKCFIEQYNHYGLDGKRTLSENIADNGGLRQAYDAFKSWNSKQLLHMKLPGLENISVDQMFFISYGSIWCTKYAHGVLNYTIQAAEHVPSPYRLKITLTNLKGFSKAFSCDKNPLDFGRMCSIW